MVDNNASVYRPRIEPTPAAAPSLGNDKANRPLQGALKLVIDGSDTDSYFGLDTDGCSVMTNEVKDALRFRCSSLPNATLLERIVSFNFIYFLI